MPTDFDWKTWKKRQNEPPPPPPEEPKMHKFIETLASVMLYIVLIASVVFVYISSVSSSYTLKVVDHCTDQKGVAVPTVRGDVVCIREDALTEVLGKSTNPVK